MAIDKKLAYCAGAALAMHAVIFGTYQFSKKTPQSDRLPEISTSRPIPIPTSSEYRLPQCSIPSALPFAMRLQERISNQKGRILSETGADFITVRFSVTIYPDGTSGKMTASCHCGDLKTDCCLGKLDIVHISGLSSPLNYPPITEVAEPCTVVSSVSFRRSNP